MTFTDIITFNVTLKVVFLVKARFKNKIEDKAAGILINLLSGISFLQIESTEKNIPFLNGNNSASPAGDMDVVIRLKSPSFGEQLLIVEVKGNGQPRYANQALNQLLRYKSKYPDAYLIFMAPFISGRSAEICKNEGVGYIDFSGNCYISFKSVFIEKENYPSLFQEKRELRSLFSPKATRVLRILLDKPRKIWKVQEMANKANVSLGLASNIKKRLLEQELINEKEEGIFLSQPEQLLNKWSENYSYKENKIKSFYSIKSIPEIESEISKICDREGIRYALTGFSGAARLSPSVRYQQVMIYVEKDKIEYLAPFFITQFAGRVDRNTKLPTSQKTERGANIALWVPYDEGVFYGSRVIDEVNVATPEQIYLDLKNYPGRGSEATEVLLEEVIKVKWNTKM